MRKTPISRRPFPAAAEFEREEGAPPSAAGLLFTATQRRVLALLFGQADRAFHMQELFASTGTGNGAVQRELARLQAGGLVTCDCMRGRKFYQADRNAAIFTEIEALVRNSFGLAEPLRQSFAAFERCAALMFAYVTRQGWPLPAPALDVLLVLKAGARPPPHCELMGALDDACFRLGRGVTLSRIVFVGALAEPDEFLGRALTQPRTRIFGDEKLLLR